MAGHTPFDEIRQQPAPEAVARARAEHQAADQQWADSLTAFRQHLAGIGHPVDHLTDDQLARLIEQLVDDIEAERPTNA